MHACSASRVSLPTLASPIRSRTSESKFSDKSWIVRSRTGAPALRALPGACRRSTHRTRLRPWAAPCSPCGQTEPRSPDGRLRPSSRPHGPFDGRRAPPSLSQPPLAGMRRASTNDALRRPARGTANALTAIDRSSGGCEDTSPASTSLRTSCLSSGNFSAATFESVHLVARCFVVESIRRVPFVDTSLDTTLDTILARH